MVRTRWPGGRSAVSEPSPRQVLYALVAGGLLAVLLVLVVAAGASGLVPVWYTVLGGVTLVTVTVWSAINWTRTVPVLVLAIGLFLIWTVGTLLIRS
jgi:hypothetical protein